MFRTIYDLLILGVIAGLCAAFVLSTREVGDKMEGLKEMHQERFDNENKELVEGRQAE